MRVSKFGEAKNYNNPRFNIRGQQIHYSKKILTSTRIRVKKYRDYIIYTIKLKIYSFMGENVYNTLKGRLKKMFDK